jgi:hypothetical protein
VGRQSHGQAELKNRIAVGRFGARDSSGLPY